MPEQAKSALVLHCGAREVTREELARVATPAATETWFPVSHDTCVATVQESLTAAGFEIRQMRFGLARNDARMFATVDLASPLATGVSLAVGIRNSLDKSLPLGFCAGSRTFVYDNLSFGSDLVVNRKHTPQATCGWRGRCRWRPAISANSRRSRRSGSSGCGSR